VPPAQSLSDAFAALGDPTRLAIVSRLASEGDMTVQDIARPFAMSLPAVSQHLKVLERAGLIARGREGQTRPCRLNAERLAETARWFDHTRAAWEARLDRLEGFLAQSPQPSPPQPTASKGEDHEP
jgi:DNA-binding transcriptional ArsR family regulator